MPGPQPLGFTGVDWYSRPTERLAGDLLGGAGPRPITAAAQETARLAAAYGTAAVELDRLLHRLDGALETDRRPPDQRHLERAHPERRTGPLPDYARWLAAHAADLAKYAAKLDGHAAAYEVAARAMPPVADAERLRTEREHAQAAAAAGGADPASAALAGAAARSEHVEQQTHATAAAVMVGFERAAEPLRVPWELTAAPRLSTRDHRGKERGNGAGKGSAGGAPGVGAGIPAAPLTAYVAGSVARDQSGAAARPVSAAASSAAGRGFPMMPPAMMGAGAGSRSTHQPSGAAPSNGADELPDAFVVHTAPDVLGGHDADTAAEAL